jgi:hypothetical protein
MWFYHEGYHDAFREEAAQEELLPRDRRHDEQTHEPIPIPVILTWFGIVGVALCIVAAVIGPLS